MLQPTSELHAAEGQGQAVEIWRGNTLQIVRADRVETTTAEAVEIVRGAAAGPYTPRFEVNRYLFSEPERRQLERDLAEIPNVYAEILDLASDIALRRELQRIDVDPPERASHRHAVAIPEGRRARRELLRDRAKHEASHAILAQIGSEPAFWIEEGLATYFEHIETRPETTRIEPDLESDRLLHEAAREHRLIGLERVLALPQPGPEDERERALAVAEAWSMVYFLMRSEASAEILAQILRDARDACGPDDLAAALDAHYPDGVDGFRRDWTRWRPTEKSPQILFETEPEPEPAPIHRRRRAIRCVPGSISGGPGLFCSQIRPRGVGTQIFRTGPTPPPSSSLSISPR